MKIILIRHGQTEGNQHKKYIGSTDESLCSDGINMLNEMIKCKSYPNAQELYVSPMKRCIETIKMIYPGREYKTCKEFRECNFGEFENKNYIELSNNENYQKWIDSNGTLPFPGGESHENFKRRCTEEFENIIDHCESDIIAFVVHGGTIMSILDQYAIPHKGFYDWQLKNGEGFICEVKTNGRGLNVIDEIKRVGDES